MTPDRQDSQTDEPETKGEGDAPGEERRDDDDGAAHLPRAPFFSRISGADLFRIGMFATLLIAIIVLRKPCADSVGRFMGSFEDSDAGAREASGADAASGDQRMEGYRLIPAAEAIDVLSDGGTIEDLE